MLKPMNRSSKTQKSDYEVREEIDIYYTIFYRGQKLVRRFSSFEEASNYVEQLVNFHIDSDIDDGEEL
jgi:hypothetical protein